MLAVYDDRLAFLIAFCNLPRFLIRSGAKRHHLSSNWTLILPCLMQQSIWISMKDIDLGSFELLRRSRFLSEIAPSARCWLTRSSFWRRCILQLMKSKRWHFAEVTEVVVKVADIEWLFTTNYYVTVFGLPTAAPDKRHLVVVLAHLLTAWCF